MIPNLDSPLYIGLLVIDKAIIGSDVIIRCNSYIDNGDDIIVIENGSEIKADLKAVNKL